MLRHRFEQFIVAGYIFAAENDGASLFQCRFSVLPCSRGNTTLRIPLAHPALRRNAEQGRRETVGQHGIHFICDGTQVDDRSLPPGLWHLAEIDPCGLGTQILDASMLRINIFKCCALRRFEEITGISCNRFNEVSGAKAVNTPTRNPSARAVNAEYATVPPKRGPSGVRSWAACPMTR